MRGKTVRIISIILILACLSGCASGGSHNASPSPSLEPSPSEQVQTPTPSPKPTTTVTPAPTPKPTPKDSPEDISAKRDLLVLMIAYPGYITGIEEGKGGSVYVVMKSGVKILYDDKKKKTYDEKMSKADLEDELSLPYSLGDFSALPKDNNDPGRFRPYALFNDVYGDSKQAVEANLKKTDLGGAKYPFNKNNEALGALEKVFGKLGPLCDKDADIKSSVYPLSGTFNYRYIAGTELYSMHSYGVAIDLHASKNPSFRTVTTEAGQKRLDSFPRKIVSIFEDNGFIWGGKWAHFDIMHFEYRPEIIYKAKYKAKVGEGDPWYKGFPDNDNVKGYIKIIDEAFR